MKSLALLALIFGISNANAQTDTCDALKTRLAKLELAESKLEPIQSKLFKAKAALCAYILPLPMLATPLSGSTTSPVPEIIRIS